MLSTLVMYHNVCFIFIQKFVIKTSAQKYVCMNCTSVLVKFHLLYIIHHNKINEFSHITEIKSTTEAMMHYPKSTSMW